MKDLNQFPLVRVLLFLIPGIMLGEYFPGHNLLLEITASICLFSLIIWFWILNKRVEMRFHFVSGVLLATAFLSFGYLITSHGRAEPIETINEEQLLVAMVKEAPVRKGVKINVSGQTTLPNQRDPVDLMIVVRDTHKVVTLLPGDRFLFHGRISPLQFPVNPGGFDYNTFLRRKGISGIVYCDNSSVEMLPPSHRCRIKRAATITRYKLLHILKSYAPSEELYAIAGALLIGYDDDLSRESRAEFSKAGAMHILCVSGLHVGVIFLILNVVLKHLLRKRKLRWLRYALLLGGLWSYAFVTGLSPSVMRATVMLSFVVTGNELERYTSVYNSISASALLLLFINPMLLFSIGFQLSYAAVIAIIALQKPIAGLFTPKNKILRKCWEVLAVSIAAQAGTFALAAYYFHSFPTLFLITNLVVIPLASLILYTGIIFLSVSMIPVVGHLSSTAFFFLIDVLRRFTGAVADVPHAALENINLTGLQALFIALLMISITYLVYNGIYNKLRFLCIPVSLLILAILFQQLSLQTQERIVIYSDYRDLVVEVMKGRRVVPLYCCDKEKDRSFTTADAHRKYGAREFIDEMPPGYCGAGFDGCTIQFFILGGMRMASCEGNLSYTDIRNFPEIDVLILKGMKSSKAIESICKNATKTIITTNSYDHIKVLQAVENNDLQVICTAKEGAYVLSAFYLPGGRIITSMKTGR